MRRDKRRFPMSPEAEALITTPGWERLSLADGDVAQAVMPGIRAKGEKAASEPDSGPAGDDRDTETGELF